MNNLESIKALLEVGANANQGSKHGDTALHYGNF